MKHAEMSMCISRSTEEGSGRNRANRIGKPHSFKASRCIAFFILPFAVLAAVESVWAADATITINTSNRPGKVNPLVFGQNVPVSFSGLWNSTLDKMASRAESLIKPIGPTVLRFPGGGLSDLYFWEDGISYRTGLEAKPGDLTVVLTAAPNWKSVQHARFLDASSGPFGDSFSFDQMDGSILTGVSGFQATHGKGAKVRPDARTGQPEWFMNAYGINEHMKLAESLGAEVVITVNFSTGLDESGAVLTTASLEQRLKRAAAWVAYLNGDPGDTKTLGIDPEGNDWKTVGYWAGRRAETGHSEAWKVTYWEIGNELFSKSETGCTTAKKYAEAFKSFSAAMKAVDPSIKVGAVGMSNPAGLGDMDTSDEWNATVLKAVKDDLDFFVVHPYYPSAIQSQVSFQSDAWFKAVMAGASQAVSHLTQIRKSISTLCPRSAQIGLAMTEYGIWPADSTDAKDFSNLGSALNNADLLMEFLRHKEDLGISLATAWNLHGNVSTSIIRFDWSTGTRLTRPQYFTFLMFAGHITGQRVDTVVKCTSFSSSALGNMSKMTSVPTLNAIASITGEKKLVLLTLNRSLSQTMPAVISIKGYKPKSTATVLVLTGASLSSNNENVSTTVGIKKTYIQNASGSLRFNFPARSLVLLEFESS